MGVLQYFLAGVVGSLLNLFVSPYIIGFLNFIPILFLQPLLIGLWVLLAGLVVEQIIK